MTITGPSINKGRSKQDYGTPPIFIEAVVKRFGQIICDLAATKENRVTTNFYNEQQDSLAQHWADHYPLYNLWLNPPFADIAPWAERCAIMSQRRRGFILLLTPASIGTDWFAKHVNGKAMVLGLSPRLTFVGISDPYPKDLMLSVFGYGLHGFDTWRWNETVPTSGTGETK